MAKSKKAAQTKEAQSELPFDAGAILAKIDAYKMAQTKPVADEIEKLEVARAEIDEKLRNLNKLLDTLEGRTSTAKKSPSGSKAKRTKEEAKADGEKMVQIIKSKGKDGAEKADFGDINFNQSVVAFVEKTTGQKVTTTGAKAGTRYHLA